MAQDYFTNLAPLGLLLSPAILRLSGSVGDESADAVVSVVEAETLCLSSDAVKVYAKAGGKGGLVSTLGAGHRVEPLDEEGSWRRVAYADEEEIRRGWVRRGQTEECFKASADELDGYHPFGHPIGTVSGGLLLTSEGYDLYHDPDLKIARWVGYCFAPGGENPPRAGAFYADDRIPVGQRAEPGDYKGAYKADLSGFDRGHQAPDATIKALGRDAQRGTYALSNITPQYSRLNQGIWQKLEGAVRRWARVEAPACVTTGPLFEKDREIVRIGPNRVAVPHAYFAVVTQGTDPAVISFRIPNEPAVHGWEDANMFLTSVDAIEEEAGFDLLPKLADEVEDNLEAEPAPEVWAITDE